MRDYVCSVNGLHHAQAPAYYDCTVVSIYDMTLTTHSVMCHIIHMEHYTIPGSGIAIYAFR